MKICEQCGTMYDDNVNQCYYCGYIFKVQKKKKSIVMQIILGIIAVFFSLVVACFGLFFIKGVLNNLNSKAVDGNYTIMVYMVGSDLESQGGCATADIKEMLKSDIDLSNNHVVVYAGGCSDWQRYGIAAGQNTILELQEDGSLKVLESYEDSKNMGEPETFTEFINYVYENYKTNHYALICWDHGSGPLMGFGNDELFDNDSLTLPEMKEALGKSVLKKEKKKLDWIGFDACLMSSIEVANVWKDYADYMVASQEMEMGTGWNYDFLASVTEEADTKSITDSILESYKESFNEHTKSKSLSNEQSIEYTLSCIDLSKVKDVTDSMDKLFSKMENDLENGNYAALAKQRSQTKSFAEEIAVQYGRGNSFDLVDMTNMAQLLQSNYSKEGKELEKAVGELVVSSETNIENANGVSIYYPYYGEYGFESIGGNEGYKDLSVSEKYVDYIAKFTSEWENTESSSELEEATGNVSDKTDEIQLALDDETLEKISSVTYTILSVTPYEEYYPLVSECQVLPDNNNVLHIPLQHEILAIKTDESVEYNLLPTEQISIEEKFEKYVTRNARIKSGTNYFEVPGKGNDIYIEMKIDKKNRDVEIGRFGIVSQNQAQAGKQDVNLDEYTQIGSNGSIYFPAYDSDGEILPYDEWDSNFTIARNYSFYSENFSVETISSSDVKEHLVCQITIEDIAGNRYGSELIDYPSNYSNVNEIVQQTAAGRMTFNICDGYATLISYDGSDEELVIPDTVEGATVIAIADEAINLNYNNEIEELKKVQLPNNLQSIGAYAFKYCKNLEYIDLPDTLSVIGTGAFTQCEKLKEITLPKSVKLCGPDAFGQCTVLTKISVETENNNYKSVDGVLYDYSMKKIIQYPAGGSTKYTMPDELEVIEDFAFDGCTNIEEIVYSENITHIGLGAFYNCFKYEDITIPDSVIYIGDGAFSERNYDFNFFEEDVEKTYTTVYLGSGLQNIGTGVFGGRAISSIDVSENNEFYCSDGKMLFDKEKDILIVCCSQEDSILRIPEGVKYIYEMEAFSTETYRSDLNIEELVLPDSLKVLGNSVSIPSSVKKITIGKKLEYCGSIGDLTCIEQVIISADNPYFVLEENAIYNSDKTTLYCYLKNSENETVMIPEGVKYIHTQAFAGIGEVGEIIFPSSFEGGISSLGEQYQKTEIMDLHFPYNLVSIEVNEDNPYFASENGLLYDKSKRKLLYCPEGRKGTVVVADGVEEIGSGAISSPEANKIIFPNGLKRIYNNNFIYSNDVECEIYLPDSIEYVGNWVFQKRGGFIVRDTDEFAPIENLVIHLKSGTKAEEIAKERNLMIAYD